MANEQNVRLWVEALRSGEFIQGFGTLERVVNGETRNCCLGVACRVAIGNGIAVNAVTDPTGYTNFDYASAVLPLNVRDWLDINETDPFLTARATCTTANDKYRYDFNKIADMIEERYLNGE